MKQNKKYKFTTKWDDNLIWCPSQIYRTFEYNGKQYQLYGRWRWDDPWHFGIWGLDLTGKEIVHENFIELGYGMKQESSMYRVHRFAEYLLYTYLAQNEEITFKKE